MEKAINLLAGQGWRTRKAGSQMSFTAYTPFSNVFLSSTGPMKVLGVKLWRRLERPVSSTPATAQIFQMLPTHVITHTDHDSHYDTSVMKGKSPQIGVEQSAWPLVVSRARQEWKQQKTKQHQNNVALDSLMMLVGLEAAKSQFMTIKNLVDTASRQGADLSEESFGAVFMGNSGLGKSTVAGLYAHFLSVLGVVPDKLEQTTGSRLADGRVKECKAVIGRLEQMDNRN